MKYNDDGFSVGKIFTDKKYKARFILLLYVVFFIILGIGLRSSGSIKLEKNEVRDDVIENEEENEETESEVKEKVRIDGFDFISGLNYDFEYKLNLNNDIFTVSGMRYNDKMSFTVTNNDEVVEYLADGGVVKLKKDNSFISSSLPYYYVNYFDSDVLQSIISQSEKVSDNVYEISNLNLSLFIDSKFNYKLVNKDSKNRIETVMKNGKVVGLILDFASLFDNVEELNVLKIELNYSNFGLIDDFDVIF